MLYVVLSFFCYGGWYSMMPTFTTRLYGIAIGPLAYGIIFLGFPLAGWLEFGLADEMSWNTVFWFYRIIIVCGIFINYLLVKHLTRL